MTPCVQTFNSTHSKLKPCINALFLARGESRCREPSIQNGRRAAGSGLSFATGSSVKFECDDGFVFEGANYAQCNNGQWKLPVCKRKCPHYKPDSFMNIKTNIQDKILFHSKTLDT